MEMHVRHVRFVRDVALWRRDEKNPRFKRDLAKENLRARRRTLHSGIRIEKIRIIPL